MALTVCLCCTQTGSWLCLIALLLVALLSGRSELNERLAALKQAPLLPPLLLYCFAVVVSGSFTPGWSVRGF